MRRANWLVLVLTLFGLALWAAREVDAYMLARHWERIRERDHKAELERLRGKQ